MPNLLRRNFADKAAPVLVSTLEAWRGPMIFSRNILEETGDKIHAFNGFDSCRQASQIMDFLLKKDGFENFKIVRDATNLTHQFGYDASSSKENPIIVDATWKQVWSFSGLDLSLNKIANSDDENLSEEVFFYVKKPRRNEEKVLEFERNLSKIDPIFFGPKSELDTMMKRLHEQMELAFNFGEVISPQILQNAFLHWDGGPKTWHEVAADLDLKIKILASPGSENPRTMVTFPEAKAIEILRREVGK